AMCGCTRSSKAPTRSCASSSPATSCASDGRSMALVGGWSAAQPAVRSRWKYGGFRFAHPPYGPCCGSERRPLIFEAVIIPAETGCLEPRASSPACLRGERMLSKQLAASVAVAVFLITGPGVVRAEQPINVETWPDDIPCNVLKKDPDGTYEITVPWTRFFQTHTG